MAIKKTAFQDLVTSPESSTNNPRKVQDPTEAALSAIQDALSLREGEPQAAEASGPHGQLRVPTMEERALIFLRATKGKEDFTNDEYMDARGKILDTMAANFLAGSEADDINKPETTATHIEGVVLDALSERYDIGEPETTRADIEDALKKRRLASRFREARAPMASRFRESSAALSASLARMDSVMARESSDEIRRAAADLPPAWPPPKRKSATVRMLFWGVVIFIVAALCALGGVTLVRIGIDFLRVSA